MDAFVMAPLTTVERLAVLESLNINLQADVSEIKHDVKELARAQAILATELASKTAAIAADLATKTASLAANLAVTASADSALSGSRASTGIWVRAIVPWLLAGMGVMMSLFALSGAFK